MDCGIVVSRFVLQLWYNVHFRSNTFGKGMNPFILLDKGKIVRLLFFWENGFGIKSPTKVDMPLNKETKPNFIYSCNVNVLGPNVFIKFTMILNRLTHLNSRWNLIKKCKSHSFTPSLTNRNKLNNWKKMCHASPPPSRKTNKQTKKLKQVAFNIFRKILFVSYAEKNISRQKFIGNFKIHFSLSKKEIKIKIWRNTNKWEFNKYECTELPLSHIPSYE